MGRAGVGLAILAGGGSRRMGQDKALKPFLGRPLIERVLARLAGLADEIFVVANRPEQFTFLNLPLYSDLIPGRGVLGGLYTALAVAQAPLLAVAACDMPFASAALFAYEAAFLAAGQPFVDQSTTFVEQAAPFSVDAAMPSGEHGLEPLHAVYRRETCLPLVRAALDAGEWKLISWLSRAKVRYIIPAELAEVDPLYGGPRGEPSPADASNPGAPLAFWNLNTPQEFAQAEDVARRHPESQAR